MVNTDNVLEEALFVDLLVDDKGVIHKCAPEPGGFVAKELAKILKPLVGKSPYHINSTQDFVEQVKHITLAPGECLFFSFPNFPFPLRVLTFLTFHTSRHTSEHAQ